MKAAAAQRAAGIRRRLPTIGRRLDLGRVIEPAHLPTAVLLLVGVGVWSLLSQRFGAYLVPSPGRVLRGLGQLAASGAVWTHVGATLRRIGLGFGGACVASLAGGFLAARSRLANLVIRDVTAILNSTSVFVWIVLAMIWFGLTDAAPSFTTLMITLPVVLSNVLEGVANVDHQLLEMGRAHGLGALDRFRHITLPSTAPYLVAGMRNGFALGLRVSVVAEIFGVTTGIGYMMNISRDTLRTDLMFAWALVLIGVMVAADRLVFAPVSRRVGRWRSGDARPAGRAAWTCRSVRAFAYVLTGHELRPLDDIRRRHRRPPGGG
jgi:NitT/TauT family transport system permease protein